MLRQTATSRPDTRTRIFRAGIEEFAARGYDGAGVDRIARRARVNKALIYYYFESKRGLYHAILLDSLRRMGVALAVVIEGPGDARAKLDGYVEALSAFLDDNAHLPPIMLRELAEGGRHLDVETLRAMAGVPGLLVRLVGQGRAERTFGDVDPLMLHFVILGTTMLMASNAPVRRRIRQLGLAHPPVERDATTTALKAVARRITRKDHRDALPIE